jgi:glycosyltransferase involved in cell wall biosynthesis
MTGLPTVSVVLPVRNGATTIGDTLAALEAQAVRPPGYELLVVDNGSDDRTQDIVRAHGVTPLEEPTPGPSAARNCGLRSARGDVVACLDADTVPSRRWLAALVSAFADPTVLFVAGRTLPFPPRTPAERYVAAAGVFDAERLVRRTSFPYAPSLNMAVRRDAAMAIGGWAEELTTAEDVDFAFRLLRRWNTTIGFQPDAVLFHRNRSSDEALRRQAWTYGEGVAHMYARHPDELRWDGVKSLRVVGWLAMRSVAPGVLAVGRALGQVSPERLEFARYHRLWTWSFWRGFASAYREKRRRS